MVFRCSTDVDELIDRLINKGDDETVQVMSATVVGCNRQLGPIVIGFKIGDGGANFGVSLADAGYCADELEALTHQPELVRLIRFIVRKGHLDAKRIKKSSAGEAAALGH
jgi:hypothetical protein